MQAMTAFHSKFSWTLSLLVLGGVSFVSALPSAISTPSNPAPSPSESHWHSTYRIPAAVQNKTAHARFEIDTPAANLGIQSRQILDAPQLDVINNSVFDRWYFDAVAEDNPHESLVVTLFASSATAFPFLDPHDESVLIAYAWASFANGSSWAGYLPATLATVSIGDQLEGNGSSSSSSSSSSGVWEKTGFRWDAMKEDLSVYEVSIDSPELAVKGKLNITARSPPHLPCGLRSNITSLQIAPHIGWVNLVPDAVGSVDVSIGDTRLKFQGAGYHDKNWSDRNFTESVRTWYWGHGRLGPYSIVWFSYLGIDDPSNTTYVSSYVARDGKILVSSCDDALLSVRPTGGDNETSSRYPPYVGDEPDGFKLEFFLREENTMLRVNVSSESQVAGDGEYYSRCTGTLMGEVVSMDQSPVVREASLTGVAVFERFQMEEVDED